MRGLVFLLAVMLASAGVARAQLVALSPEGRVPSSEGAAVAPSAVAPSGAQAVVPQAPVGSAGATQPSAGPATRPMVPRETAVLQVLDKISARTTTLRVPVGGAAAFGLIVITVRSCQTELPGEAPESAAFLEINEVDINSLPRSGGAVSPQAMPVQKLLFSGWMFASSPALSALEHPVYDVTVIACESATPSAAPVTAVPDATVTPGDGDAAAAPED